MSVLGRPGWNLFGQWFGRVCILWPIYISVIGILIALLGASLAVTGVGAALAAILFWIDIVLMVIMILLPIVGIIIGVGVFVSDMIDNLLSNLWNTHNISSAWNSLKTDVSNGLAGISTGIKTAVAPLGNWLKAAWKKYGWW